MPPLGIAAVTLVTASAMAATYLIKYQLHLLVIAVMATAAIPASYFVPNEVPFTWDVYFTIVAWLVAGVVFPVARGESPSIAKRCWNYFGMLWCLLGALVVCATGYDRNRAGLFYIGIGLVLFLVVLGKRVTRPGPIGIQFANTLILLALGLPIADAFVRPPYLLDTAPDLSKKYYSFEVAHKDPSAYARWWRYYLTQWDRMAGALYIPDPDHLLPFRLRPGGTGYLFNSKISINSRGFRGKEIPVEKGDTYRIVTLGESTTFGCTLNKEDRPWPELLEDMIRERLKPSRPVEVINAGVPSYVIIHNLRRLRSEIFPLKPDLLISYHGYNGFFLLQGALPGGAGAPPPRYVERPMKLFAKLEYKLKLTHYKSLLARKPPVARTASLELMQTPYAKAYEDLIRAAETNGVRLALANFSMAVTTNSPTDDQFFRGGADLWNASEPDITTS
jgi:hypothetical protein